MLGSRLMGVYLLFDFLLFMKLQLGSLCIHCLVILVASESKTGFIDIVRINIACCCNTLIKLKDLRYNALIQKGKFVEAMD